MIDIGIQGRAEGFVTKENTAMAMGSGDCPVFATPAMVALMEKAASESVVSCLQEGETTVGIMLSIRHNAATVVGRKVWAESELIQADARKLVFRVNAFDEVGEIGEGEHVRAIVCREKFLTRASQREIQTHQAICVSPFSAPVDTPRGR